MPREPAPHPDPLPLRERGATSLAPPQRGEGQARGGSEGRRLGAGAGDPIVGAREALGVDRSAAPRCAAPGRASAPARDVSGIDRQPLDQQLAGRRRSAAASSSAGHGALGIDVIGRHRRDAAPIIDAGGDQLRERAGAQIGRRLDVHARPEDQPRHGDRPQMVVEVGLGRLRHAGAGLGAEILDDDFLDVAVAVVQIAQGEQRLDALAPRLADADQDAGGERDRRLAGRCDRREARTPGPCRASRNAARRGCRSRSAAVSSMMPCETETVRSRAISARVMTPGLRCGSSPVSCSTRPPSRRGRERGLVAEPRPAPRARRA